MRGSAHNHGRHAPDGVSRRARSILHVDLDPLFISVERRLDPTLRGRPLVIGGNGGSGGVVAAASTEARALGVRAGLPVVMARRLCPSAIFKPGDLETYARFSDEVTAILLDASRRVERPSADEAFVDLSRDGGSQRPPVAAAESIKDELQQRLGLDASLGLATSRLAACVASRGARPRGLLVVLPGYESSFLARQPLDILQLAPQWLKALHQMGIRSLGDLARAPQPQVEAVVGTSAVRLQQAARGEGEAPIAPAAPPHWIHEDAIIHTARTDAPTLLAIFESLACRAARRLRPFNLAAGTIAVEVRRGESLRREERLDPGVSDEETAAAVVRGLAEPLLEPSATVRALHVRCSRLGPRGSQASLLSTPSLRYV